MGTRPSRPPTVGGARPTAAAGGRAVGDPGVLRGESARIREAAWLAGWLWIAGGASTLISSVLPAHPGAQAGPIAVIAVIAVVSGMLTPRVPWERFRRWTLHAVMVPVALVVIAVHNLYAAVEPYRYGVFYVVVFSWIGLTAPRRASLLFAPLAAVSYHVPLMLADAPPWALASTVYVVPILVAIAEMLAWMTRQRNELADALASSRRRSASLVANASDVIMVLDDEGRPRYASPSVTRVLGYPTTPLAPISVVDLVHPEDRAVARAAFQRPVEPGALVGPVRIRVRHRDGHWLHMETVATDQRADETIGGWVLNSRDVTQQERDRQRIAESARELAAANEQLREADRLKDEFVSLTSHELRTPLTSIVGFTSTVLERWDALDDARRRELLGVVHRNGQRLSGLVDDLLTMSRALTDRLQPQREKLDLRDLARRTVEDAGPAGAGVDVDVPADLVAYADAGHVARILLNLLTNAAKYGAPPVVVRGTRVDEGHVALVVRDHGAGVDEAFIPSLFDRFSRRTADERGLGLGLSIVRALAHANGGDIAYEHADPGARFVLTLPTAER